MDLISYAMGKQASGGSKPTGTIEITSNGTHDVSNYASANVNVESIDIGDYFVNDIANTSGDAKNLLKRVPPFTITRTNVSYLFSSATNLEVIEGINGTDNTTHFNDMFQYCTKLTTLPVFSWASAQNLDRIVTGCNRLNDDSLNNLMYMCIHCNPNYAGQKKLSALGVSSSLINRCPNLSNYQAFLDAGWTLS